MANIKIAIVNETTVLIDGEVPAVVNALQRQVHEHFAAVWGIDADLTFVPKGSTPFKGAWWLVLLDNSDQAGALGYHDLTPEGMPMGKVFVKTDMDYQQQWSVTASHELLEMLGDPDVNLTVFVQPGATSGTLYAYEVCDACEADELGYPIDGVQVSDFVYPSWFESFWQPGATQFDYRGHINQPLQILQGGYIGAFDVTTGTGWHQLQPNADRAMAYYNRARVGSRRERRRIPRDQWLKSTAHRQGMPAPHAALAARLASPAPCGERAAVALSAGPFALPAAQVQAALQQFPALAGAQYLQVWQVSAAETLAAGVTSKTADSITLHLEGSIGAIPYNFDLDFTLVLPNDQLVVTLKMTQPIPYDASWTFKLHRSAASAGSAEIAAYSNASLAVASLPGLGGGFIGCIIKCVGPELVSIVAQCLPSLIGGKEAFFACLIRHAGTSVPKILQCIQQCK